MNPGGAVDADQLMERLVSLTEAVQFALDDAFGPFFVFGLAPDVEDAKLVTMIGTGRGWAQPGALSEEGLVMGSLKNGVVDVSGQVGTRVAIGMRVYQGGIAVPGIIRPGDDHGSLPLAISVVGYAQTDTVFDLRAGYSQERYMKTGGGSVADGGAGGEGFWTPIGDSLMGVYLRPNEGAEITADVFSTEGILSRPFNKGVSQRTLEVGFRINLTDPGNQQIPPAVNGVASSVPSWAWENAAQFPPVLAHWGGDTSTDSIETTAKNMLHCHCVLNDGQGAVHDPEPTANSPGLGLPDNSRLYVLELRIRGRGAIDKAVLTVRTYRRFLYK